jgi:hypothetical protein
MEVAGIGVLKYSNFINKIKPDDENCFFCFTDLKFTFLKWPSLLIKASCSKTT